MPPKFNLSSSSVPPLIPTKFPSLTHYPPHFNRCSTSMLISISVQFGSTLIPPQFHLNSTSVPPKFHLDNYSIIIVTNDFQDGSSAVVEDSSDTSDAGRRATLTGDGQTDRHLEGCSDWTDSKPDLSRDELFKRYSTVPTATTSLFNFALEPNAGKTINAGETIQSVHSVTMNPPFPV